MDAEVFQDYPDVVNVQQLRKMLGGIGVKAAYGLLREGKIAYIKVGKGFLIPKASVVKFLNQCEMDSKCFCP